MVKKNNESPIEQVKKHKEYLSPQVENYLAFRLAKKSFMLIITTIGLLTALLGYLGINYTKDLRQQLDETRANITAFEMEISQEREMLNKEISSFQERMDTEIKKYDKLSNRYEKSLSNLEILRSSLDQQMNIVMDTFLNNIAKSNEKLFEEISGLKELNEKSKEMLNKHKKLNDDLENLKKELENGQQDFINKYSLRINKILESQIIWIRQDLAETKSGFKIEDKNLFIKLTNITRTGKKQEIIGLRVYSSDNKLIKNQQNFKAGERIEFIHPETKENYILELKIIIDGTYNNDYAGFVIRTKS
jgi:methyl-accepting chemotaxis protein